MTRRYITFLAAIATTLLFATGCAKNYPDDPQKTGCTAHLPKDAADWQAKTADWEAQLNALQTGFSVESSAEDLQSTLQQLEQLGQTAQSAAAGNDTAFQCLNEDGSVNAQLDGSEGAKRRSGPSRIASQAQSSPDGLISQWLRSRYAANPEEALVAANIIVPLLGAGPETAKLVTEIDAAEQARLDELATAEDLTVCTEEGLCNCVFSSDGYENAPPPIFFEAPTNIESTLMRCYLTKDLRDYEAKAGLRLEVRSFDSRSVGLYIEGQEPVPFVLDTEVWGDYLDGYRKKKYIDVPLKLTGSLFTEVLEQMAERGDTRRVVEVSLYALVPEDNSEPMIIPMASGHLRLPEDLGADIPPPE